jgi:deoxycytidylate deaminase
MIINAGIRRVVYAGHYPDENSRRFLSEAGVILDHQPRGQRGAAQPPVPDSDAA